MSEEKRNSSGAESYILAMTLIHRLENLAQYLEGEGKQTVAQGEREITAQHKQRLQALYPGIQAEKQHLAEATALLETFAGTEPVGYGAESSTRYCPYCNGSDGGSDEPEYDPVEHAPDCPWLKLRAFLAQ